MKMKQRKAIGNIASSILLIIGPSVILSINAKVINYKISSLNINYRWVINTAGSFLLGLAFIYLLSVAIRKKGRTVFLFIGVLVPLILGIFHPLLYGFGFESMTILLMINLSVSQYFIMIGVYIGFLLFTKTLRKAYRNDLRK